MLRIEHLTKTYGGKKAVDDLSLHIRAGEIYGFIGHNGAGKTTTIKSCCGILQFEEGEIYVDGASIREDPIGCKRKIAYLPDNPDLNFSAGCSISILLPMFMAFSRRNGNSASRNMPISLALPKTLLSLSAPIPMV